jgi:FtsH-binding integral membrane protein
LDHGPIDRLFDLASLWPEPSTTWGADMIDLFAWIVLIILALSTVAVIVFLAMLPGYIARKRNHPWAQAVTVAGWITLFLGFALWPIVLIWAYVDIPAAAKGQAAR